jgi:hypothetical protein
MSLLNAICPLWILGNQNRPDFVGSSTLLRFGDGHFLVSCAHVADNIDSREVVFIAGETLKRVSGQGRISNLQPGEARQKDRVDSFFIRLSEETAAAMREFYHFASPDEIALGQTTTASTNYTFMGSPMKLAQLRGRVLKPEERSLTAAAMTDEDYAALKLTRFTHVGIRLNGGRLVDLSNRRTNLSQLNGISGGPGTASGVSQRLFGRSSIDSFLRVPERAQPGTRKWKDNLALYPGQTPHGG